MQQVKNLCVFYDTHATNLNISVSRGTVKHVLYFASIKFSPFSWFE